MSEAEQKGSAWAPRLKRLAHEVGGLCAESGVLVLVFGLLDHYRETAQKQAENPSWPLNVWAVGGVLVVVGILLKLRFEK